MVCCDFFSPIFKFSKNLFDAWITAMLVGILALHIVGIHTYCAFVFHIIGLEKIVKSIVRFAKLKVNDNVYL